MPTKDSGAMRSIIARSFIIKFFLFFRKKYSLNKYTKIANTTSNIAAGFTTDIKHPTIRKMDKVCFRLLFLIEAIRR